MEYYAQNISSKSSYLEIKDKMLSIFEELEESDKKAYEKETKTNRLRKEIEQSLS